MNAPSPSPCIGVCALDRAGRLCIGCWRTIEEIAAWGSLDEEARHVVLARLPARRAAEKAAAR